MSITLYTGCPGSGKSLHCTENIIRALKKGQNVIANYNIEVKNIENKKGEFVYKTDADISVEFLINYVRKNHKKGIENQTIVVLDEAQLKFNSRSWQQKDRWLWNKFFTVHRHLGFDIVLATQQDSFLDSQIRGLIEYELRHKNIKKSKLGDIFPFMPNWFICNRFWYHSKMKMESSYFFMKDWVISCYDSYIMFDKVLEELLPKNLENNIGEKASARPVPVANVVDKSKQNNLKK